MIRRASARCSPRRYGLALGALVLVAGLLAGCGALRSGAGAAPGSCAVTVPAAFAAVGHRGRLVRLRRLPFDALAAAASAAGPPPGAASETLAPRRAAEPSRTTVPTGTPATTRTAARRARVVPTATATGSPSRRNVIERFLHRLLGRQVSSVCVLVFQGPYRAGSLPGVRGAARYAAVFVVAKPIRVIKVVPLERLRTLSPHLPTASPSP